ncbi:MAG: (4Fe-4S)-binding protein [Vicingaceae bacterium]
MSETEKLKEYQDGDLTVEWRPERCIHSGVCTKGLSAVFKPKEKPWIQTEGATNDRIIKQIKKCPSRALAYQLNGELEEKSAKPTANKVNVLEDGPLVIEGACEVKLPDGKSETRENAALCRCGYSQNKPYCDGSHSKQGFKG